MSAIDKVFDALYGHIEECSDLFYKVMFENQDFFLNNDIEGMKLFYNLNYSSAPQLKVTCRSTIDRFSNTCSQCQMNSLVVDDVDAVKVCTECGFVEEKNITSLEVEADGMRLNGNYTRQMKPHVYKRISHFVHILNELTGFCETFIPLDLIEAIKKEKPTSINDVRKCLKKLQKSSYICAAPRIFSLCSCDHEFVLLNQERKDILKQEFKNVCTAWDSIKEKVAPERKSFLNYQFILTQICIEVGFLDLIRDLKKIKSCAVAEELHVYWDAICKERRRLFGHIYYV